MKLLRTQLIMLFRKYQMHVKRDERKFGEQMI